MGLIRFVSSWSNLTLDAGNLSKTVDKLGWAQLAQFPSWTKPSFLSLQSKSKERSFSWYYVWTNVGNLGGELGMPILRQSVGFPITLLTVVGEWLHGLWLRGLQV